MLTESSLNSFQQSVGQIQADLPFLGPEVILTLAASIILLGDLLIPRKDSRHLAVPALVGLVGASLAALGLYRAEARSIFSGMLVVDPFSTYFKLLFLLATAVVVLITYTSKALSQRRMGEYYSILLFSLLGAFIMASASDLLMFYIGVEMLSVPSYILTGYDRRDAKSAEASLKYVIYGAFASGAMLYGISLLYGFTGSTNLARVAQELTNADIGTFPLALAVVLVFAGLAYKMSAVPMHFWTPDVYQGAPTPITAYLSVPSKAAGFALFIRLLFSLDLNAEGIDWLWVTAVVAAVTMTLGNLAAIWQDNVKRMLGYSSIAHAGYLLMGVAALHSEGFPGYRAILFYLAVYLFMNLGAFAVVVLVHNRTGSEEISAYRGLGFKSPALAVSLTICLVSLIGIPPTAGFVGKLQLLTAVIYTQGLVWLAVLAVINTAVSAYYYLRIVKAMYLEDMPDESATAEPSTPLGYQLLAVGLAAITIWLGIFFNGLNTLTAHLAPFRS